ncbi:MAG: OmpA family protein [Acetobacteraceae bacterium]|nr:OmpA family protein [Acetobacteraceae bacterium]
MRAVPVLLAGLLLPLSPVRAQVTTNDSALDSLGPRPAMRHAAPRRAVVRHAAPTSHPTPSATPPAETVLPAKPAAPAKPVKPAKPEIPVSPPAILAIPPAVAVPLAHPPPPPVVPLADDAPGAVRPIENGVRVTFGPDRSDMSPTTAAALARFAQTLKGQTTTGINVFAYAAGSPDDPSNPRRLSLQRALAARAVLLQAGIPSPRIYPRALGPAGGDEPDRVDVVIGTSTPPAVGEHE